MDKDKVNLISIDQKLNLILSKLEDLDKRIAAIETNTLKMDSHIDFVESVYDNIKSPFHRIMNMIQGTPRVPMIE